MSSNSSIFRDATGSCLLLCVMIAMLLVLTGVIPCSESHTAEPYYEDHFNIRSRHIVRRQTTCDKAQFKCRKTGQCISVFNICDGNVDCEDGTDEIYATCFKMKTDNRKCERGLFRCAYGACISSSKKCDGVQDCADNSDELLIECPHFKWTNATNKCGKQFQCRNGECIDSISLCDGAVDCRDGSDETVTHCNNPNWRCPPGSAYCAYGACLERELKCNGHKDCVDGSDEDPYLCNYTVETTTKPPPVGSSTPDLTSGCTRPSNVPGTNFEIRDQNTILMQCEENYNPLNKICRIPYLMHCDPKIGTWEPQCYKCVPNCKPLHSVSVNYSCTYNDIDKPCTSDVRFGTIVSASCAPEYETRGSQTNHMECGEGGQWRSTTLFSCAAKCGLRYQGDVIKPQIAFGNKVSQTSQFPWNTGLYFLNETSSKWEHGCGGTIISAYVVLTAAHCVYSIAKGNIEKSSCKVTVGKYFREFAKVEENAKTIDVAEVHVHPNYKGEGKLYENDIALIELTAPVIFSQILRPACILFSQPHTLLDQLGIISGWGRDETGKGTDELKWAELKYLTREHCLTLLSKNNTDLVTRDKFCARLDNRTSVMQGDSGAGLLFPFSVGASSVKKYYVYGIVSVTIESVAWFTDLTMDVNSNFVDRKMAEIERKMKD